MNSPARKRRPAATAPPAEARRVGRPKAARTRKSALSLRAYDEWVDWLKRFADHRGQSVAVLISEAVEEKAWRERFEAPPRR